MNNNRLYCTIYMVRHGETDWNKSRFIQGHTDIPLNETGKKQALELNKRLLNVHFDAVFSSDLMRAKETAEILALERTLAVTTTKMLRERFFGRYEGKSGDILRSQIYRLVQSGQDHPEVIESGIEPTQQVIARTFTFLREISISHLGKQVLVVCHGGIMRTLLVHLGFYKDPESSYNTIQNAAYIKLRCDGTDFFIDETQGISEDTS